MVEIGINRYQCGWCGEIIDHMKRTVGTPRYIGLNAHHNHLSAGHKRATNALRCPNCGRLVSQKPFGRGTMR